MIGTIHLFLTKAILKPLLKPNFPLLYYPGLLIRELLLFIFKCDLSPLADIPYSTQFPHYIGIVIGGCTMGEKCVIRPNVIIGRKDLEGKNETLEQKKSRFPTIGSNVVIGSNACILGPVNVGSSSVIGAGSVVLDDVEANCVYAGVPARKIKSLR